MKSPIKYRFLVIIFITIFTIILTLIINHRNGKIRFILDTQVTLMNRKTAWNYTTENLEFTRYINAEKPETDDNFDVAFEVINNETILPPSARIRARKMFKNKPMVMWATEWHMTPIKDVADLIEPFGVEVKNYNLDPYRCQFQKQACKEREKLKILKPHNVLDAVPEVVNEYVEVYANDSEMHSVDVVYCGYPASLCEIYVRLNKSVLVLATTRYDVGRYTVERWNKLNENFRILAKNPWNIFGGNNLYDARFIQYYTGIKTHHIPSMCDYTGAEYTNTISTFLVLRRRDRGFNEHFYKEFEAVCRVINCSAKIAGLGGFSYTDLAKHRGVIHVPYQISVMSIFEQYRMNIPMFFPSPELLARWQVDHYIMPERSFDGAFHAQRPSKSIIGPDPSQKDVPDPKNELDYESTKYWMNFADFYQIMPYGVIYESIPHLVHILNEITDEELMIISSNMRRYNVEFKKKLLRKWRKILLDYAENSANHPH